MEIRPATGRFRSQQFPQVTATSFGILMGLIFISFSGKEIRWSIGFVVLALWIMILCVMKDKKRFLINSLFLAFTIQTTVDLWMPRATVYSTGAASTTTAIELFAFDPPLILLLLLLGISSDKNRDREFSKSDIAAVLFTLACGLSFINSSHRDLTLARFPVMLRMPLIYYCISRGITSRNDLKSVSQIFIFCVVIQSSLAILQTFFGSFEWLNFVVKRTEQLSVVQVGKIELGRATGTIGYTTVLAQYLGMLSPFTLVFFLFGTGTRQRVFAGIAYLLSVIALILSLSRIEWVCLPLVIAIIAVVLARLRKYPLRKFFGLLSVFLVLCLIGLLFSGRIISRITGPDDDSAYSRIPMAKTALRIITANPVFGIGLHNYTHAKHDYGGDRDMSGDFAVHNSFLYLAAEIGLFGLLFLLFMWLLTYKRAIYCVRNADLDVTLIALGLITGLTILFLHSMVEHGFHIHQQLSGMLWGVFGLAAAMKTIVHVENSARQKNFVAIFAKGILSTGSANLVSIALGFLNTLIAARFLQKEEFGVYILIGVIVSFYQMVGDLCSNISTAKFVASAEDDAKHEIVGTVQWMNVGIIFCVRSPFLQEEASPYRLFKTRLFSELIIYVSMLVICENLCAFFASVLVGLQFFGKMAIGQIVPCSLNSIFVISSFTLFGMGLKGLVGARILALAFAIGLYYWIVSREIHYYFDGKVAKGMFLFGFPLWLNNILTFNFKKVDVLLIGSLLSPTQVAYYGAPSKVPEGSQRIYESYKPIYFPHMAN